jgi:hypothetical protein
MRQDFVGGVKGRECVLFDFDHWRFPRRDLRPVAAGEASIAGSS